MQQEGFQLHCEVEDREDAELNEFLGALTTDTDETSWDNFLKPFISKHKLLDRRHN